MTDTTNTENEQNLELVQQMVDSKINNDTVTPVTLSPSESMEIDNTFKGAKDFREIGEKITGPIEGILKDSLMIVEKDPIMDVSKELSSINGQVQTVYKEILDNDGIVMKFLKQLPGIGEIARYIDSKFEEVSFNIKSINAKLEAIFSGFDTSYESINKSLDSQKQFLLGIDENLGKVISYNTYLKSKLENLKTESTNITDIVESDKYKMFIRNMEFFTSNLDVLISNLELARKRIIIRLDSGVKLALAMNSSRPIFKVLLSSAVIEMSSQKAIDASIKSIEIMGSTIDKMSKNLTDSAISSNEKAEELSSKSILDTRVFVENVEKLKKHFDHIEEVRQKIKIETEDEKKLLNEANTKLEKIKNNQISDYAELNKNLM